MNLHNRRKHFLIDLPLQFRFMGWILLILLTVSSAAFLSLYFGIWSHALQEFSDESVRNTLRTTSRLRDYQVARFGSKEEVAMPRLAFIKETELFSQRQREMIHDILEKSNKRLIVLSIPLLFFIAWSTIFLSHKIAGPLYRINRALHEIESKNLTVRIRLRRFDEGKKVSETFNLTLDELDRSLAQMKKILNEYQDPTKMRNELSKKLSQFKTTE